MTCFLLSNRGLFIDFSPSGKVVWSFLRNTDGDFLLVGS